MTLPFELYCHRTDQIRRDLLWPSSSTSLLKRGQLEPVAQDCIHWNLQEFWRPYNLSGQLVPVFDHPHSKKMFSCVQMEFHMCFILCPLPRLSPGTEQSLVAPSSFPLVRCLQPSFFQTKEPQPSQPLLMWKMLQSLGHRQCPLLDLLQWACIFLILESQEQDTALIWQINVEVTDSHTFYHKSRINSLKSILPATRKWKLLKRSSRKSSYPIIAGPKVKGLLN